MRYDRETQAVKGDAVENRYVSFGDVLSSFGKRFDVSDFELGLFDAVLVSNTDENVNVETGQTVNKLRQIQPLMVVGDGPSPDGTGVAEVRSGEIVQLLVVLVGAFTSRVDEDTAKETSAGRFRTQDDKSFRGV